MDAPTLRQIRDRNTKTLHAAGFRFADWLPARAPEDCTPRPAAEVLGRLAALRSVVAYVTAPEDRVPSEGLRARVAAFALEAHLTPEELAMWRLPRAEAHGAHANTIGWRMENMVPLAWALGCAVVPRFDGVMLGGDDSGDFEAVVVNFLPRGEEEYRRFAGAAALRPAEEIVAMEDLFYCAHNAVRSAQHNDPRCVPKGFDPIAGGGVVHERRHALTWILSPGVAWDDTDLST